MASFGQLKLSEVMKMLEVCAPGHTIEHKKHHVWVRYKGKTFRQLSLGKHGARTPEVEVGIVKKLANFLELDSGCVYRTVQVRCKLRS